MSAQKEGGRERERERARARRSGPQLGTMDERIIAIYIRQNFGKDSKAKTPKFDHHFGPNESQ